jgi:hypothetical protein
MMYSAHFDASGTDEFKVLTVAGCISSIGRWISFQRNWNRALVKSGLPAGTIFHMTDFATCHGPFKIFRGKSVEKAVLFSDLVSCMVKHVSQTFSVGVVIEDHKTYDRYYCLHEQFGAPYSFAGLICLKHCLDWIAKSKAKRRHSLEVFFEKGDEHQNELEALCKKLYDIDLNFKSKAEMVQFQPGDIVAWKNRTAVTNAILHGEKGDPKMLASIQKSILELKRLSGFSGVYDDDALQRYCDGGTVTKRF